jgi:surface antigen
MNKEQEQLLSAYVDGELSGENLEWVESLLANDREAGLFVDTIRKTNQLLSDTYAPVVDQSIPQALMPQQKRNWTHLFSNPTHMMAAASVAVAVFVGGYLVSESKTRQELEAIQAKLAELRHHTLEYSPSGTPVSWNDADQHLNLTIEPLKTYRTQDNRYCREYREVIEDSKGTEVRVGLACRSGKTQWDVRNEPTQQPSGKKEEQTTGNPKVIL